MDIQATTGNKTPLMHASVLYGLRDLRMEALPRPTPGPGEVLLKVARVGVCGSDVHYYLEGRIGDQVVVDPIIMGHEFSAHVAELGPGVEGLVVGQLVAVEPGVSCGNCEPCQHGHPNLCLYIRFCGTPPYNGVFAEYTVMPSANCYLVPGSMDSTEAAMLEPLGVALHSVDLAHLKPGSTVAILGAGPIGLLVAAVARTAGATDIYMTEPLSYRRDFAQRYVADAVFNPDTDDVTAEIMRLTNGRGVDVAFEAAGAPDTPQLCAELSRYGGTVVLVGIPVEDELRFMASTPRRKGLNIKPVRRMKHTFPRTIRLVASGQIDVKPLATHLFPLERIAEAFDLVAGRDDGVLRAMIGVSD